VRPSEGRDAHDAVLAAPDSNRFFILGVDIQSGLIHPKCVRGARKIICCALSFWCLYDGPLGAIPAGFFVPRWSRGPFHRFADPASLAGRSRGPPLARGAPAFPLIALRLA